MRSLPSSINIVCSLSVARYLFIFFGGFVLVREFRIVFVVVFSLLLFFYSVCLSLSCSVVYLLLNFIFRADEFYSRIAYYMLNILYHLLLSAIQHNMISIVVVVIFFFLLLNILCWFDYYYYCRECSLLFFFLFRLFRCIQVLLFFILVLKM